ncbi:hypothetical protein [Tenacibaculum xiamenense]|uniref:hypothetical protein n=1 Tax=Tenacibaculum xiamenense TaxID=1261553 RepID=UPI0038944575
MIKYKMKTANSNIILKLGQPTKSFFFSVITIVLFLFSFHLKVLGQETKLDTIFKIHKNSNWKISIETISFEEFNAIYKPPPPTVEKMNWNPSLILAQKVKNFSKTIVLKDSCCFLNTKNKTIKLCNSKPEDDRKISNFELIDIHNDFLIFMQSGYEWWNFIGFNPTTKSYFYTQNDPIFINKHTIYSYGNYYGEGQFDIQNLNKNLYFAFDTFNWELSALCKEENVFYLKLTNNTYDRIQKYFKLTI